MVGWSPFLLFVSLDDPHLGYIKNDQPKKAIDLFDSIQGNDSSTISYDKEHRLLTLLIDALLECGRVDDAESTFNQMKKTPQLIGVMMKGFLKNKQPEKAIALFNRTLHRDRVIYILIFNACAQLRNDQALLLIKNIAHTLPKSLQNDSALRSSLFNALIKCGDCGSAEKLFERMEPTVTSYGNLMNGFNTIEQPEKTLQLFQRMQHNTIEPNRVVFLCLIKALALLGLSTLSEQYVDRIPSSYRKDPWIQTELLDMWVSQE
jgi:pentatricopeptide repeat protein